MKTTLAVIATAAVLAGTTGAARADIGISGDIGTTGVGGHATIPLRPQLNLRVGFGRLGYSYSGHTDSVDYDLGLKGRTYDALLDWYPQEGKAFRLTGGIMYNGNKIDVRAKPGAAGNYSLQGNVYSAANVGQVTGTVDFGKFAPYLGVGWNTGQKEKGWSVATDLGLMFQGAPRTSLNNSGCNAGDAVCGRFQADVQRESAALNSEVGKFKVYPVLRIGLNYKF